MILVTGGSGSGKSAYAEERLLSQTGCIHYYIATMQVFGEEGRKKVERHKKMRQGKGFLTVERQTDLGGLLLSGQGEKAVLLECLSNLTANEMFADGRTDTDTESLGKRLLSDIKALSAQCRELVIVTNEIASDGEVYEAETMEYIRLLGWLNVHLAHLADEVVEVVYGIPVVLKKRERKEREEMI